jgi:hypothetical protein
MIFYIMVFAGSRYPYAVRDAWVIGETEPMVDESALENERHWCRMAVMPWKERQESMVFLVGNHAASSSWQNNVLKSCLIIRVYI